MYSSESKFSQGLARKLKPCAEMTRIESHITPGVPDAYIQFHYEDMWVELKNYKCSYTEWDNGVVAWRPGQQAWAATYRYHHSNRCVVTLIALSDGYYFVPMTHYFEDFKVIKNDFYFIPKKEWSKLSASKITELLYAASTTPSCDATKSIRYNIYMYIDKIINISKSIVPVDFDLDIFTSEYQKLNPKFKPEMLDDEKLGDVCRKTYSFLQAMKFEILRTIFTMEDNEIKAMSTMENNSKIKEV